MSFIEDDIKAVMKGVGKAAAKRLAEPTATWNHKVTFKVSEPKVVGNNLVMTVTTEDEPYLFLNDGTEMRRAVMSFPYIPKTKPGSFHAYMGRGRVMVRGRFAPIMPGITAREWTPMAALEYEAILQAAMDQVCGKYKIGKGKAENMPFSSFTP